MKRNERYIIAFAILFPIYIYLLWLILSSLIANYELQKSKEKGFFSASIYESQNSTYYYLIGRYFHYITPNTDPKKSIIFYRKSIELCPLQGGCWLDLSKACQSIGDEKCADYSLQRALKLMPNNPVLKWEAGIYYLISGDIEKAYNAFKEYLVLKPEKQEDIYDLIWKLPYNSQKIIDNLLPFSYRFYKGYLLYLMATNRKQEAVDMWEYMKSFQIEENLYIKYIDFLISEHSYDTAYRIWKKFLLDKFQIKEVPEFKLWNGSFEYDIQNGAFDWKIQETEGVDVFIDKDVKIHGSRSIGITFDGKHNPDITIASQIVKLKPGKKYRLKGNVKTDSLTTTNGIYFSVNGHDCNFYKESEILTGTKFWKEVLLEFELPLECNAVSINIRRAKSTHLNNKISGNAWIDSIEITPS